MPMTNETRFRYPLAAMDPALTPEEFSAEEWRYVVGSDGRYQVSNLGRVRCLFDDRGSGRTYFEAPRLRRIQVTGKKRDYRLVCLALNGKLTSMVVHRLVAESFIGPRPQGHDVAHLDGRPWNNRAANLAYKRPIDNHADKRVHGTLPEGVKHWGAKITEDDVRAIRQSSLPQRLIAAIYGMTQPNVSAIRTRKTWDHV